MQVEKSPALAGDFFIPLIRRAFALIKIPLIDSLNPAGLSTAQQSTYIPRCPLAAYTARMQIKMNQDRQSEVQRMRSRQGGHRCLHAFLLLSALQSSCSPLIY
jgi:hypothetical protein